MPNSTVIHLNGELTQNSFKRFDENAQIISDVLLTVAELAQLEAIQGKKGVLLTAEDSPETIQLPLNQLDLIAIEFTSFTDGRGYSFAVLLRRQGFKGEIRAVGDVFKDVIFYLKRCGFDSFIAKEGKDSAVVAQGLHDFSAGYQQALVTESQPNYQTGK